MSNTSGIYRNSVISTPTITNHIGPYLQNKNCVLNILNIYGCNIGNRGFISLADSILKNNSIFSLNLG
jgi:hypothetical protein